MIVIHPMVWLEVVRARTGRAVRAAVTVMVMVMVLIASVVLAAIFAMGATVPPAESKTDSSGAGICHSSTSSNPQAVGECQYLHTTYGGPSTTDWGVSYNNCPGCCNEVSTSMYTQGCSFCWDPGSVGTSP